MTAVYGSLKNCLKKILLIITYILVIPRAICRMATSMCLFVGHENFKIYWQLCKSDFAAVHLVVFQYVSIFCR